MSSRSTRFAVSLSLPLLALILAPTPSAASTTSATTKHVTPKTNRTRAASKPSAKRATPRATRATARTTGTRTSKTLPKVTSLPMPSLPGLKPATTFTNWAGYQVDVAHPTQAHAAWIVPKASWPGRDGYSNVWVGLGGGTKEQGQLVQAGTEQDIVCKAVTKGRCTAWSTQTYAWIETYPQRNQERITNMDVAPGDAVDVTVRWSAADSTAYFTLCNDRTSECVETSRVTSAPKGVAEFIVERPSVADGTVKALADIGKVTFTSVDVERAGVATSLSTLPGRRIHMQTTDRLATTGPLTHFVGSFSVTFVKPA